MGLDSFPKARPCQRLPSRRRLLLKTGRGMVHALQIDQSTVGAVYDRAFSHRMRLSSLLQRQKDDFGIKLVQVRRVEMRRPEKRVILNRDTTRLALKQPGVRNKKCRLLTAQYREFDAFQVVGEDLRIAAVKDLRIRNPHTRRQEPP